MRHYKLRKGEWVVDWYRTDRIYLPEGTEIGILREFSTYAECYIVSNVDRNQPDSILVSYSNMENV